MVVTHAGNAEFSGVREPLTTILRHETWIMFRDTRMT